MKHLLLMLTCICMINFAFSQQQSPKPQVLKPVYFDVSPPLRDMVKMAPEKADYTWKDGIVKNHHYPKPVEESDFPDASGFVQSWFGVSNADTTIHNWAGISGNGSLLPPDTDGDVGPNHYFQVVNCQYAIYDKTGVKLMGPTNNSSIFSGLPNNSNDGDAVVLYDEVADRWLFSQFSLPNYPNGPFFEMVAISSTPDPTGTWYRYQFQFTDMPDYPKLSVWPDGYYMTTNRFSSGTTTYKGTGAVAMDRTKMLTGDPSASMIFFTLGASTEPYAVLPSDCDGEFPPVGTPNYFMYLNDGPDHIGVYEFHADWTNPTASTYTSSQTIPVAAFSVFASGPAIPQKNTSKKLDAMSGRFMFRLPFRKFNDHWSIAACGTVKTTTGQAGLRWYELRKTGSNPWAIYQEGTYAPDDNYRWMGSIAMDTAGNMALGYSVSSSTMFPALRYTGRLATDPLNQLTIEEGGIVNGGGAQTDASGRWGDYSAINVDPSAEATFWFTSEYYTGTSATSWKTRIASFTFANVFDVEATASPDTLCTGGSTQLDAGAVGGSGAYTYTWTSTPSGFTSSIANPVVSPTATTTYKVVVTDGVQTISDTVRVTVANEPAAFAGNDTTYSVNVPIWPVNGHAEDAASTLWQTLGDGTFLNANLLYALYTPGAGDKANGYVELTLTAYPMGTCTTADVDTIHVILSQWGVGIADLDANVFGMALTPNPSKGQFVVNVSGVKGQDVVISVSNMQGNTIVEQRVSSASQVLSHNIDMRQYSKGVYIVKVKAGNNSTTAKMVIE